MPIMESDTLLIFRQLPEKRLVADLRKRTHQLLTIVHFGTGRNFCHIRKIGGRRDWQGPRTQAESRRDARSSSRQTVREPLVYPAQSAWYSDPAHSVWMTIPGDARMRGSRRGRNSQAKGLESDKPLESRSIGTEEASPRELHGCGVHLSGMETEARPGQSLSAPFCTRPRPERF